MTDTATPIKRSVHCRVDIGDHQYGSAFVDVVRTIDGTKRDSIAIQGSDTRSIFFPRRFAGELAELLTTAARWTDEPVVDAEIVDDDRPRLDYDLLAHCLVAGRPLWMEQGAARDMAEGVARRLNDTGEVVIVRDGLVWVS